MNTEKLSAKPSIENVLESSEVFIRDYFEFAKKVVEFNRSFMEENGFREPSIDFLKLKRFIDAAIDSIKDMDEGVVDRLTGKLLNDVNGLHEFIQEFEKKLKTPKIVFKQEFLKRIPYFNDSEKELEKLNSQKSNYEIVVAATDEQLKNFPQKRDKEQELEYRKIKKTNVDTMHKLTDIKDEIAKLAVELAEFEKECYPIFVPPFATISTTLLHDLHSILNTKISLLNALFWSRARNSKAVLDFFRRADIKGEISLKTHISYYIRGVDMNKIKNCDWHNYLNECLKELDV